MSQAMLTAVLLSCALLLALPTTLGAQMGLAPLEGIRRPDQALLPEFPGLGLQALLKKTTAEQSEEALLQKAEALAEVSTQGKGQAAEGASGTTPSPHLWTPSTRGDTAGHPSLHSIAILHSLEQVRCLNLPSEVCAHSPVPLPMQMLDPQNRELRSPRRCVRLHESCLGQQVPCCDPCATCYCRFFNAFCYCRKLGTATNPCSRT
nr:agouti-related protein isoform X1 [Marmota flaviventris]